MKKLQKPCLLILILFCIDYSITQLLGFSLLYERIKDMPVLHLFYAFIIGVSGFISILSLQRED